MVALDINIGLNAVIMAVTEGAPRVLTVHKGVPVSYTHLTLPTKRIV